MYFDYLGKKVYYEVHGVGEPLLLLNGIFMTCASWNAFVPAFSRENQLILVDFLDQGKSDKVYDEYKQGLHVDTIMALLQHLSIAQVSLVGISYGGEVAMQFALQHPNMVKKLVLSNTTAHTTPWLEDMGKAWEYALKSYDGRQFFKTCIPIVYSPEFYNKNIEWARKREELFTQAFKPETYDAFLRLVRSAEGLDLRDNLPQLAVPTLVISAEFDYVTPVPQQDLIVKLIPNAAHVLIKRAGHAVMYEKPVEFASIVLGFINTDMAVSVI